MTAREMGLEVDMSRRSHGQAPDPAPVRRQDWSRTAAHDRDRLAEEDDTAGSDVEDSWMIAQHSADDGLRRVVFMQELQAWIETGERRHDGKREVARERRVFADPKPEPQDAHLARLVAQGELADQLLHVEQVARDRRGRPLAVG